MQKILNFYSNPKFFTFLWAKFMNFTKNSRIKIQKRLNPHKQNLKFTPPATKTALLKKPFELKFKNQKFFSLFLTNANNLFTALKRKQYSLNAHFACIDIVV